MYIQPTCSLNFFLTRSRHQLYKQPSLQKNADSSVWGLLVCDQWTCTVTVFLISWINGINYHSLPGNTLLAFTCGDPYSILCSVYACVCVHVVCVYMQLPLESNICWVWAVISTRTNTRSHIMHIFLYLPVRIIRQDSSLYNLHSDVSRLILGEAQAPPACVYKQWGQVGWRAGGLHRVRTQPSPIMIYIVIIGRYMSSGVIAHIFIAIALGCVQFSGDIITLNTLLSLDPLSSRVSLYNSWCKKRLVNDEVAM